MVIEGNLGRLLDKISLYYKNTETYMNEGVIFPIDELEGKNRIFQLIKNLKKSKPEELKDGKKKKKTCCFQLVVIGEEQLTDQITEAIIAKRYFSDIKALEKVLFYLYEKWTAKPDEELCIELQGKQNRGFKLSD